MSFLPKLDRQVYKYAPDQMIVRLNTIIDTINTLNSVVIIQDENSDNVVILGRQPDKSFGIALWHKQGDNYTLISRIA